jgi:hypothetical protein
VVIEPRELPSKSSGISRAFSPAISLPPPAAPSSSWPVGVRPHAATVLHLLQDTKDVFVLPPTEN